MNNRSLDINKINLIAIAKSGRLKDLSAFLYLKSFYSNSCVFNYTQKSLAEKSGLSLSAVRKYIKSFLNSGWCKMHGKNLLFVKLNKFDHNKKKVIVKFEIADSIKQIFKDLQLLVLKNKQNQFNRYKQLSLDLHTPQNLNSYKAAQRTVKRKNIDVDKLPGEKDLMSISMSKIASMLGCSVGSAHNRIKELKKSNSILCVNGRKEIIKTSNMNQVKVLLEDIPNSYYHNGYVMAVSCNKYRF